MPITINAHRDVAQVDPLHESTLGQTPEVQVVPKPPTQQIFGVQPVLEHRRRRPLRRHSGVLPQVPPDVVGEVLLAAVQLERAGDVEGLVVEQRDPAWPVVAVWPTERADEDPARTAVHGVRPRVPGLRGEFVSADFRNHRRCAGSGLVSST
jgi:hypothetical protein